MWYKGMYMIVVFVVLEYVTIRLFVFRSYRESQGKFTPVRFGLSEIRRIEARDTAAAGPFDNGPGLNPAANCPNGLKAVQRGGDHRGADVRQRTLAHINNCMLREPELPSLPLTHFWGPKEQVSNGHPPRTVVDPLETIDVK